jgi:calcium/calmodulin-dependent protein kinase I
VLLCADDDNDAVLFEKIKSGNYDADDPIWENISIEAKDVVAKLLTVRAVNHSAASRFACSHLNCSTARSRPVLVTHLVACNVYR